MANSFKILKSNKAGLNSQDGYIIVRGKTSFLRILGAYPVWEIMTATASEDNGSILVCSEQLRLVQSALLFGKWINEHAKTNVKPSVETDWLGREYVNVCSVEYKPDNTEQEFFDWLTKLIEHFFQIYDSYIDIKTRPQDEMIRLYNDLSVDDFGGEVYLSDGVWLSNDGSLHDQGR